MPVVQDKLDNLESTKVVKLLLNHRHTDHWH
jgi:hypothetical protein